jgi:hypothetical protein
MSSGFEQSVAAHEIEAGGPKRLHASRKMSTIRTGSAGLSKRWARVRYLWRTRKSYCAEQRTD